MNAVEVIDLHKNYGDVYAVQGVNFHIEQGEVFSLLGPNGAGKTTTISMLSCLLEPTQGDAIVFGHSINKDPLDVKRSLGVVPQDIAIYEDMSARDNLLFWGRMFGLRGSELKRRVNEVLEVTDLTERQKGRAGKFSGGMKRRLNIGIALLHKPRLVIMDEPTVGVDPQSRRRILDSVLELKEREGMTVLYTTHYMEEAAELSDHIAIMDSGKVIAYGTHDELITMVGELDRITLGITVDPASPMPDWTDVTGVESSSVDDGLVHLLVKDSNLALPDIFMFANNRGIRVTSVDIQEPNLETVFLHLTGRALRD